MSDDDVTVDGLGSHEVSEIMQSDNTCPCASDPRAKHARWCQARAGAVGQEGEPSHAERSTP